MNIWAAICWATIGISVLNMGLLIHRLITEMVLVYGMRKRHMRWSEIAPIVERWHRYD